MCECKGTDRVIGYLDLSQHDPVYAVENMDYLIDGLINTFGLSEIQAEQIISVAMTTKKRKAFLLEGLAEKVVPILQPLIDAGIVPIDIYKVSV